MPDEDKKMVPIDTSGPDATIDIEEQKDEAVVETAPEETTVLNNNKTKNHKLKITPMQTMTSHSKNEQEEGFLYADNLIKKGVWSEFDVTIVEVIEAGGVKFANGQTTNKPTLVFKGTSRKWVLPKTQQDLLKQMLGNTFEEWIGKKITLRPAVCKTPQGEAPCVRVKPTIPNRHIRIGVRKQFGEPLTGQEVVK
jgi:hypothetical protein